MVVARRAARIVVYPPTVQLEAPRRRVDAARRRAVPLNVVLQLVLSLPNAYVVRHTARGLARVKPARTSSRRVRIVLLLHEAPALEPDNVVERVRHKAAAATVAREHAVDEVRLRQRDELTAAESVRALRGDDRGERPAAPARALVAHCRHCAARAPVDAVVQLHIDARVALCECVPARIVRAHAEHLRVLALRER